MLELFIAELEAKISSELLLDLRLAAQFLC
jgi:hypothetical protein